MYRRSVRSSTWHQGWVSWAWAAAGIVVESRLGFGIGVAWVLVPFVFALGVCPGVQLGSQHCKLGIAGQVLTWGRLLLISMPRCHRRVSFSMRGPRW